MNFNELYPKKKEYYHLLMDIKTTAECNVSNCVIDKQKAKLLMRYINKKENEIERLKRQIKIKDEWCDRIWEIGTDYDGYGNNLEELKKLVDELIEYSNKAKRCDEKSVAYIGYENGKEIKKNILMEELGSDKE